MSVATPMEVMARLAATWSPEAMGNPAVAESWMDLFDEDMVLFEPESLPHGGRHERLAGFRAAQAGMRELWEQRIEHTEYWECGEDRIALRIVIRWTSRATGRSVVLPMIDFMRFRGGKIYEVEAFVFDTAALLATLD